MEVTWRWDSPAMADEFSERYSIDSTAMLYVISEFFEKLDTKKESRQYSLFDLFG